VVYYPIFLELKSRPCLVIGGGEIAYQKAKALVTCGALVCVVSPTLGAGLKRLLKIRKISWERHLFKPGDLRGRQLVVAATNQQPVNQRASRLAQRDGIWINVVDQPELCSFIVPSVVRRGKLVMAISTGGISPALAKWIRKDLQGRYTAEFGKLLQGMAQVRGQIKRKVPGFKRRKQLFEKALQAYFQALGIRES